MFGSFVFVNIAFMLLFVVYIIPSIVGLLRKKDDIAAIIILNLFLGWSFLGWVIALVWALSKDKQVQTVVVHNHEDKTTQ